MLAITAYSRRPYKRATTCLVTILYCCASARAALGFWSCPILEWGVMDVSPQRGPGLSPWRGSGDEPPEAEETLQIIHVEKVFCASHVVPKQ